MNTDTMAALAVRPGQAGSLHARRMRRPHLGDVADGRGVLVRVLRVGVDGTDREIIEARYGQAPPGDDFLVIGHENFGRAEAVGDTVGPEIRPGMLVVATVRRPGSSVYDGIGLQDFTTDDVYRERGINLLHGYLSEWYVEDAAFVLPVPELLESVGVLAEPLSVAEKGIAQAFEIQRRLRVWRPERACVIGAGTIGLLAALGLRLRGIDVTVVSRREPPYLNAELVEAIGGRYLSTKRTTLAEAARAHGPFDLMFEATGFSPLVFEAAAALGRNGVLVVSGISGGSRRVEIDADAINQGFVLGNKVMVGTVNSSRADWVAAIDDLVRAESIHPGWLGRLLTTPIEGLENPAAVVHHLTDDDAAIKVTVEISG